MNDTKQIWTKQAKIELKTADLKAKTQQKQMYKKTRLINLGIVVTVQVMFVVISLGHIGLGLPLAEA